MENLINFHINISVFTYEYKGYVWFSKNSKKKKKVICDWGNKKKFDKNDIFIFHCPNLCIIKLFYLHIEKL